MPQRNSVALGDSQRIVVPPGRVCGMLPQIGDGLLVGSCGDLGLPYVVRWESPELRFGMFTLNRVVQVLSGATNLNLAVWQSALP